MKLRIMEEFNKLSKVFINHYDDYNLIHHSKVDQDNMFIVVEKFFFRNSSRASLGEISFGVSEINIMSVFLTPKAS